VTLPAVDTKSASAVAAFVSQKFAAMYPKAGPAQFDRMFGDINRLFTGQHPDFSPIDLRYHDLEHTLQATVCLTQLLENCQLVASAPKIPPRQFELGIAGVLLHDSGYLKLRSDNEGTGAKYTFCHVLRSCAFAASYLPTLGASETEIGGVLGAINCTGATKEISRLHFHDSIERFVGCALASSDYLAQMAAPDYPDELEILYAEFAESDDFVHVPVAERAFKSARELVMLTPLFWRKVVLPKLDSDFEGVYRFLADPYPAGRNVYIEAVEKNIALIEQRNALQFSA
jgi:hypothetical protein